TTVLHALSLHDALPILVERSKLSAVRREDGMVTTEDLLHAGRTLAQHLALLKEVEPDTRKPTERLADGLVGSLMRSLQHMDDHRSEEHTSELQSRENLV